MSEGHAGLTQQILLNKHPFFFKTLLLNLPGISSLIFHWLINGDPFGTGTSLEKALLW
jgi:hypothetical protein